MYGSTFPRSARASLLLSIALAAGTLGCAAGGASALIGTGKVVLDVLRKVFVGVAGENYGDPYKEDADNLFTVMAKSAEGSAAPPSAASAPTASAPETAPAPSAASGSSGAASPPAASSAPSAPPTSSDRLALEVGLLKQEIVGGRSIPTPVADGEILHDRYGAHGDGDDIKFMFRASSAAYVYVISIDSTGWIQPIFPGAYAGFTNPVEANKTYLFPEGSTWAPLDSYRGIEHLYFIASRTQRPDLEKALVAFASRVRTVDPSRAEEGKEGEALALARVESDAPVARGFDAPRKSVVAGVPSETGETFPVDAQIFAANGPGDIVVTRWFRHH